MDLREDVQCLSSLPDPRERVCTAATRPAPSTGKALCVTSRLVLQEATLSHRLPSMLST